MSKDSAGLRVRSHPSLQSDQIGVVHVNGTITFIDEVIDWTEIIPVSKIQKIVIFFSHLKKVLPFILLSTLANASLKQGSILRCKIELKIEIVWVIMKYSISTVS